MRNDGASLELILTFLNFPAELNKTLLMAPITPSAWSDLLEILEAPF